MKDQGELEDAEALYRRAIEAGERTWGDEDARVLACVNNLAGCLQCQGKLTEVEALFRHNLEAQERTSDAEYPLASPRGSQILPENPLRQTQVCNMSCIPNLDMASAFSVTRQKKKTNMGS